MSNHLTGSKRLAVIQRWINGHDDPDWEVLPTRKEGKYFVKKRLTPLKYENDTEESSEKAEEVEELCEEKVCSQVASYFQIVDNCVAVSDTNKQYCINPQTSYSPSPPIASGSYTSVIISPNTHNTADLYKGFIKVDIQLKPMIDIPTIDLLTKTIDGVTYKFNRVWFGFKDARDAIEKYELVANGQSIYTQNYACEESFLTACCANETTKRADIYSKARHKDVWDCKSGGRCGIVVEWPKDIKYLEENDRYLTINLKIDLRRFLPLSNIKYLPAFAGKLELRLYFSCTAMLYCPVSPELIIII